MKRFARWGWRRFFRLGVIGILLLVLIATGAIILADRAAVSASQGCLYDDVRELPFKRVALVFGCDDKVGDRDNLYFRYRIDAAAAAWKAGKLDCLIVSGDNRSMFYNEPEAMRLALMAEGVPADRIVADYAGLRTLDSVVRAKEIFGVSDLIFISQRFQNERAIYLAKANGMDAIGLNARDVSRSGGAGTRMRELGARVKMWLDVRVLSTKPKHLGKREGLPLRAR